MKPLKYIISKWAVKLSKIRGLGVFVWPASSSQIFTSLLWPAEIIFPPNPARELFFLQNRKLFVNTWVWDPWARTTGICYNRLYQPKGIEQAINIHTAHLTAKAQVTKQLLIRSAPICSSDPLCTTVSTTPWTDGPKPTSRRTPSPASTRTSTPIR